MQHTDDHSVCPFYKNVVQRLTAAGIPFAVGGAYAFAHFTNIHRGTKDLDLFVKRDDVERALELFAVDGYRGELTFPHWLAKIYDSETKDFVDLIFCSGNGVAAVDDEMLEHAIEVSLFGMPVKVCPPEEMIWTKAFVMERERYDGNDIAHLLHVLGGKLDWPRLIRRFDAHWRLLLVHLIMLGYIYPHERVTIPGWVMRQLLQRLEQETRVRAIGDPVCGGTLVSREQFLVDVNHWGYIDGRIAAGVMSEDEIEQWTRAIGRRP
ncbi:MAG TPA: nucleotidyltransferase [Polyangiales bacterium]